MTARGALNAAISGVRDTLRRILFGPERLDSVFGLRQLLDMFGYPGALGSNCVCNLCFGVVDS